MYVSDARTPMPSLYTKALPCLSDTSKARVKRIACCTVCVGTMTTTTSTGSSVLGDIAIRNKRKSTRRALSTHTYSTYIRAHTHTHTRTHTYVLIMCAVLSLCLYSVLLVMSLVMMSSILSH